MARIRRLNLNQLDGIHVEETTGPADLVNGTDQEDVNNRFPSYPYTGYHRNTIGEYLDGGGASPYSRQIHGGTEADREGLYWYNRHIQRLETMIQATGEPVILLRRKWTGEVCPCYDGRRGQARNRCPICVVPESLILTDDYNYVEIQEIFENDKVLTHTGSFKTVKEVKYREVDEKINSVKVWGNTLLNLRLTDEHPVYTLRVERKSNGVVNWDKITGKDFEFIRADQLRKKDYLCIPLNKEKQSNLTSEQARLLGYYVAEGAVLFIRKDNVAKDVSFAFHKDEKEYIEEVCSLMEKIFGIKTFSKYESGNSTELRFYSKEACDFFLRYVGANNKRRQIRKKLSKEIMDMCEASALAFIGTWCNGDGTFSKTFRSTIVRIDTSEKILAQQLHYLLLKNKIHCGLGSRKNNKGPKNKNKFGRIYYIEISNNSLERLKDVTDKITFVKKVNKNSSRVKFFDDYVLFPIKKLKKESYKGRVYNLEVEDDESYTVDSYAVHNCYGTGFVGGYVRHINPRESQGRIYARIGPTEEDLDLQEDGMRQKFVPNVWVLPMPIIRDRDILVLFDPCTGEETWRYEALSVTRNRGFFRKFTRQTFNMHQFEKTDPIYNIDTSFGTAYNATGDLSDGIDPTYDPHPGYGEIDPATGYGEAYNDLGFSEGYLSGYEKGYQDAINKRDFEIQLDLNYDREIDSPYGKNDPNYEAYGKENFLFGWDQGYREGFSAGEDYLTRTVGRG